MLRGRCSCAISERPTPSLFASPSLTCILTPLFPIHPGNYPVTPLFPLLTQKQRGGGILVRVLFSLPQHSAFTPTRSGCPAPVPPPPSFSGIRSGWCVAPVPPSLSRH